MDHPFLLISAIVGVAIAYVLAPYSVAVYLDQRRARRVRCPATGASAEIRLAAPRAAITAPLHDLPVLGVRACSEWPGHAGCSQTCLAA